MRACVIFSQQQVVAAGAAALPGWLAARWALGAAEPRPAERGGTRNLNHHNNAHSTNTNADTNRVFFQKLISKKKLSSFIYIRRQAVLTLFYDALFYI